MKKRNSLFVCMFSLICLVLSWQCQAVQAEGWIWISSDDKYGKLYDPASVQVIRSIRTKDGTRSVPTELQAWTKTEYNAAGAAETISNYGIQSQLPDASRLAYSLALVQINPQNRTMQYIKENFYDAEGNVIWSKADGRVKEINSQEFDEDYYAMIVDVVFRQGEYARCKAEDRWKTLWTASVGDLVKSVSADTSTMRKKGENLIFWEWDESKDMAGKVVEVTFLKRAVNIVNGTEKVIEAKRWTAQNGWADVQLDGMYRVISPNTPEYSGLTVLRAFAQGYSTWVNRYSFN